MWYIWLIAAGVFFIFEIATVGFLIFWLGIGSLLAMIVSFFTDSLPVQMAVFVVSSCILIPLTKPLIDKYINKGDSLKTNVFSLINKHGVVTMEIDPIEATGQVKINGEIWSAASFDNTKIFVGTEVEVIKLDGVKVFVSPIKMTSNL